MDVVDVRAIGGGPGAGPDWGQTLSLPMLKHHQPASSDLVASALAQMATHEISAILGEIEDRRLSVDQQVATAALREVAANVQQGKTPEAVARLNALVRAMPGLVDHLRREPALEPIQQHVEALLKGIAAERKQILDPQLNRAAELIETRGALPMSADGTDTRAMIAVAIRFAETGRIPDMVRAEELVSSVMKRYRSVLDLPARESAPALEWVEKARSSMSWLWSRAPLLVLMAVWNVLGMFGFISVTAWALGLLAMVGFGFWARVRHI